MGQWGRVATLLLAVAGLIAGCSSTPKTASAAMAAGAAGGEQAAPVKAGAAKYVNEAPLSSRTTTATIADPNMNNMVAATMTIPAGWKLQGTIQGNPCAVDGAPWPVYRAYSPDGLMQLISEPLLGWSWEADGSAPAGPSTGCANIHQKISAADFLEYYTGTIQGGVHRLGTVEVPASFAQFTESIVQPLQQQIQRMQGSRPTISVSGDNAALRIETVNGSFVLDEELMAGVVCTVNMMPMTRLPSTCWAHLGVITTPQGQLDNAVQALLGRNLPGMKVNPQYAQQRIAMVQSQTARGLGILRDQAVRNSAILNSQFQQSMQMFRNEHRQFMAQQESQFESSMNNANAAMNARSTAASDWVDYALDQQTVENPNGTLTKLSSGYSQTWTNGTQWYQTNDPNANPNGCLQGNWSLTTKVHGNGQPIQ
ncbi:MAG: hypothetical protein ACLGXA_16885 [Acidobacteriota bacterium]